MSPLPWGSRVVLSSWTNPCDVILLLSFIGESACLPPRELMAPWREAGRKLCVPISEIKHEAWSPILNTCSSPFLLINLLISLYIKCLTHTPRKVEIIFICYNAHLWLIWSNPLKGWNINRKDFFFTDTSFFMQYALSCMHYWFSAVIFNIWHSKYMEYCKGIQTKNKNV